MPEEVHMRQNPVLQMVSVALVASPVFAFSWAWGGMRGEVLRSLSPLLVLACVAGMLFLPQCHPGETAGMAWRRVWGRILRDPFTWTALVLIAYLVIPLFNVGLSPILDASAIAAGENAQPPHPHLPFCVSASEHLGVVCWFVPTLISALGVRHALTRTGKRALFEAIVWNGALLAALGFVQICTDAHFPFWSEPPHRVHFFSVFAYPNMAGAFFTLVYALALGLWVFRIEEVENAPLAAELGGASIIHTRLRAHYPFLAVALGGSPIIHTRLRAHYPFLAVALLFCAVLATLCRAALTLTFLLTGLFLVYVLFRPLAETGMERARRFRSIIAVGGLLLALTGVIYVYAPSDIGRELKTLNAFSVSDRVTGKAQYHTRIATAIMRDHPIFGVGGWGYRHFCLDYLMREKGEKSLQTVGGANVHNDYLQFLAEHGAVGFILMALCLYLLAKPMLGDWHRLIQAETARARSGMGGSSLAVFSVASPVLWTFLGTIAVLIHAFGDCPLRAASVLALLYVSQAIALGFLPRQVED